MDEPNMVMRFPLGVCGWCFLRYSIAEATLGRLYSPRKSKLSVAILVLASCSSATSLAPWMNASSC
eukprot:CAMPEP_0184533460 /NCGR_PEP_ID=MMETSP0198_2-20121128/14770_1 /TAXON_ID=1112570 /ORGANISM="Thraustochytrium sp., Strain LLF1b" /LENGTH=65 /DNA_ID=CAMNT_0026926241 /DNA_START=106 /DNA_END=300 /DNA_ORIENTATION=-